MSDTFNIPDARGNFDDSDVFRVTGSGTTTHSFGQGTVSAGISYTLTGVTYGGGDAEPQHLVSADIVTLLAAVNTAMEAAFPEITVSTWTATHTCGFTESPVL